MAVLLPPVMSLSDWLTSSSNCSCCDCRPLADWKDSRHRSSRVLAVLQPPRHVYVLISLFCGDDKDNLSSSSSRRFFRSKFQSSRAGCCEQRGDFCVSPMQPSVRLLTYSGFITSECATAADLQVFRDDYRLPVQTYPSSGKLPIPLPLCCANLMSDDLPCDDSAKATFVADIRTFAMAANSDTTTTASMLGKK